MNFSPLIDFLEKLSETRVPGNAMVIYHNNEEVFRHSTGYSDLENKTPMTGNELFNIYSCSKPITVTAAMQLYEKGEFLLDDPLYNFIPEYREMYVKTTDGELKKAERPITMRHLFTMSAGLSYELESDAIAEARRQTNGKMDTVTVAKCLAKEPLMFEPGEHYKYSLCHDVLAAVVEIISGKRFSEYVKTNIFDPLEIKDAHYDRPESVLQRIATHYEYAKPTEFDLTKQAEYKTVSKIPAYIFGEDYDCGGAGLAIAPAEYVKFTNAMANYGKCPNGERILSKGAVDLLRLNQFTDHRLGEFNNSGHIRMYGYGYGLGVRTMMDKARGGSPSSIGEFGWDGAAGALSLIDPETKLGFFYAQHVLSTNLDMDYAIPRLRNIVYKCIDL